MAMKGTFFFRQLNAAWSETLYFGDTAFETVATKMERIRLRRIVLLGKDGRLYRARIGLVNGQARGQLIDYPDGAPTRTQSDTPWQSVQLNMSADNGIQRRVTLRGAPDSWIEDGVLARSVGTVRPEEVYRQYLNMLIRQQAQIQYYDRAVAKVDVVSVDATGNVVTAQDVAGPVGSFVTFYRTQYAGSRDTVRGRWKIITKTDTKHFQLQKWPTGRTVDEGKIQPLAFLYANMATGSVGAVVSRRTGRPLGRQVGRRLVRR
jgi:hypothetical protein